MWNATEFLEDYNIPYSRKSKHTRQGWVGIQCPMCNDHSDHGGFNLRSGYYYCWRCGWHKIEDVISRLIKVSGNEAFSIYRRYEGHSKIVGHLNRERAEKVVPIGDSLSSIHRKYLERRGFNPDYISEKYKVRGTLETGNSWKFRVIIPFFYEKEIVTYQGRSVVEGKEPRYLNLENEKSIIPAKEILYNLDNATGNKVILVEGIFDCWRMGDGAVASMGVEMTDKQLEHLLKFKKVFILFDNEPQAQKNASQVGTMVSSMNIDVELLFLNHRKDPSELTDEEADEIKKELKI